jgi:hypothetical protein
MTAAFESVLGTGAMINWITVRREHEALYEDWYNFEHLPERVSTPGFLRARRFVAADQPADDRIDYLTLYETVDLSVLASPEYLRRLDNPTELTRRVVPLFTEFRRAACAVTVVCGDGSAGSVLAMEVEADASKLRTMLRDNIFQELISAHTLVAGSLYEPDDAVSAAKSRTAEGRSSAQQQQASSCVLLAELHSTTDPDKVAAELCNRLRDNDVRIDLPRPARCFDLLFELRAAHPREEP